MTLKYGRMWPFVPIILIISLSPALQNTVLLLPSGWADVEDMTRQTPPPCVSDLTSWSHGGWGEWTSQQHWKLWASTGHTLLPAERSTQCGWDRLGQIECDRNLELGQNSHHRNHSFFLDFAIFTYSSVSWFTFQETDTFFLLGCS